MKAPRPVLPLLALAFIVLGTGCATHSANPVAARQQAYQRLLTFLEPGMTRRQLYALLPPRRIPDITRSGIFSIPTYPLYVDYTEIHPLDRDFSLEVHYRPANVADTRRAEPPRPINARTIDELLTTPAPPAKPLPSRQNPDDELTARPILHGPETMKLPKLVERVTSDHAR